MSKINFFCDIDGLVIDSLSTLCNIYNARNPDKNVTPSDIKTWNCAEAFIGYTSDDIESMFSSDEFWEVVRVYSGIYNILYRLHRTDKFNVIFTSIGSSENIANKTKFLKREFPFVENHILLVKNAGCFPGKQIVDMSNGIIADDSQTNLSTSNAKYKVMVKFDGDKQWNSEWPTNESVVHNPEELYQEIMACWKLENREGK